MADFELISSRSDPAVQRISDVTKRSRGTVKTVLIEDPEPLAQSLDAGVEFIEVYGLEGVEVPEQIVAACAAADVPIRLLSRELAGDLFKVEKKPKVFGLARTPRPAKLRELADLTADIVVLDGVKIVGNIGAIVRTCLALGASGLVLVDSDLTSIADRRLVRASRGYVFSLPVVLASRNQLLEFLKEHKEIRPVVFDADGEVVLGELSERPERLALTLGSEKYGPTDELSQLSPLTASIPMSPAAESLNVSVSAGIALYAREGHNLRG